LVLFTTSNNDRSKILSTPYPGLCNSLRRAIRPMSLSYQPAQATLHRRFPRIGDRNQAPIALQVVLLRHSL
jgi:hypothetical protein